MQEIWIKNEQNLKLKTFIYNGKKGIPAIILCHGFSGNSSGTIAPYLSEKLSKDKLICRFDFSGQGQSEGKFYDSSITNEITDLAKVIEFLKENYEPNKIILLGHSFGAVIAMLYAAQNPVDGLISVAGAGDLKKCIDLEFSEKNLNDFAEKGETEIINWSKKGELDLIGVQFLEEMKKYSTVEAAKEIVAPVLFLHGDKDDVVPLSATEEIYTLVKSPKEFKIIDGADHIFNCFKTKEKIDELIKYISEWMRSSIRA